MNDKPESISPEGQGHPAIRTLSLLVLLLALLLRLGDQAIYDRIFAGVASPTGIAVYRTIFFLLPTAGILLNRKILPELNVDRAFINLYVISGILLFFLYHLPIWLGVLVVNATIAVVWAERTGKLTLGTSARIRGLTLALILASAIPLIPDFLTIIGSGHHLDLGLPAILTALLNADLPSVVFEEFLFRGLLWKFLRDLKLSTTSIVLIQALFFWLAHWEMFLEHHTLAFWFVTPYLAILFGLLVARTKSLTPSALSHFLFNFLVSLMQISS